MGVYSQRLEGNKISGADRVTDGAIRVMSQRPESAADHISQMGYIACDAAREMCAEIESTSGSQNLAPGGWGLNIE
jgi:hypothetical protein